MSLHIAKLFSHGAALASAALFIHIGSAMGADSRGDIQQQIKEWLVAAPATHSSPQAELRAGKETSPGPDAQERAKQLILGTSSARVGGAEGITHSEVTTASVKTESERPLAYGDVQVAAKQLLLGQPHASEARGSAARPTR